MSVSGTTVSHTFTGDASTDDFDFTFKTPSAAYVKVSVAGVVLGSGYTVTPHADQEATPGGTVSLVTPPALAAEVIVYRETPLTQAVELSPYSAFPANTIEAALDRAVLVAQEQAAKITDLEARIVALEGA